MSKAKDRQAIDELFKEFHYADDLGLIKSKLTKLCATIRQEERRAAIAALAGLPAQGTMNYRRGYEEGVRDAIRTLEAAANDQKAPDGDRP